MNRLDRRIATYGGGAVVILIMLGTVGMMVRPDRQGDGTFYTPGVTPTREDCAIARMKNYSRLDKQVMQTIATECELTVQSIEGHEKLRKAWEERQTARDAAPKPAATEPAAPAEGDRLRRVWR